MTPSTIASSMAVILACSCSRSWIFSRSRAAITLSDRPSVPISSVERVGARTRKLPSLIWRAMDCISTTGRVTRPATKMPMPSATSRATAPPASITWWSVAYEAVTAESGRARRSTPSTRVSSRTGTATYRSGASVVALRRRARPVRPSSAARTSGRPAWFSSPASSPAPRSDSARTRPSGAMRVTRAPVARATRTARSCGAAAGAPPRRSVRASSWTTAATEPSRVSSDSTAKFSSARVR